MLWGLARMMENVIGHDGVISRYSGDEFLIIVPNAGTAETLELAERLRTEAADVTLELNGNTVGPLTLTIGVACFPDDGASLTELIEAADLAVYAGKWRGKNCVISARDIQASKEN